MGGRLRHNSMDGNTGTTEEEKQMILFQHPGLGGRRVVIHGFKLDDLTPRCELCSKELPEKEMGTLTITNQKTGQTEKHFLCLECGKKIGGIK